MKQLHNMQRDSINWLDAKKRVDLHISRASDRLESWLEITYTVDELKKQNAELKVGLELLTLRMHHVFKLIDETPTTYLSLTRIPPFQVFMKELQQWQGQVDETNALADNLLTLYANDDTHKVTQVNNNMMATWTHISKR